MCPRLVVLLLAIVTTGIGCSSEPPRQRLLNDMATAMGGPDKLRNVRTLAMRDGVGTRWRLGQTPHVSDAEAASELKNVTEVADIAANRASLDYTIRDGAFVQHRHEILTKRGEQAIGLDAVETRPLVVSSPSGLFSWGTQNSPEFLLRRNIVSVVLAALDSPSKNQTVEEATFNGQAASVVSVQMRGGDDIRLFVDRGSHLPLGYETIDTEAILGDVNAQYVFSDYKSADGISLPLRITVKKGEKDYSDVRFTSFSVNDTRDEQVFAIPSSLDKQVDEAIAGGPDFSPVSIENVANGVYFARGYSHHSMIVEFPKFLTVVEAPYTEAQSKTLIRALEGKFPGKPIRYIAVTHHHYDHLGGVRAVAATGAGVLVAKGHEPALRMLVETPHSHPVDDLERNRVAGKKTGTIELFDDKKVIEDGGQRLELDAFMGSPHVEPMVLAYVPNARVLFQSDLWFPGAGSNGSAGSASAKQLLETVRKLGLHVDTNVGGHGGVAPFAELVKAVESMPKPTK